MRRQELSPAASRRGDRIRVSRIAALLGALIVLTAVHRTQAQHARDASWINPRASTPHSSKLRLRRTCAFAMSTAEISALAKSARRLGPAIQGAKCLQKNSTNFILRS